MNGYVKCSTYARAQVYFMEGSNAGWTLIASYESIVCLVHEI